jgi:hypothetical protein
MSDADILKAWDEGAAPIRPRDAAFRIAVLQKLEQRRFVRRMAQLATAGLTATVLFLAFAPDLARAAAAISPEAGFALLALALLAAPAWGLARAFKVRLV